MGARSPQVDGTSSSYRSVLRQREFGALFAAHLLSLLGDRVATVAISVLVFDRSGSVLLTAAAYATSLLPWLLGAPFLAALSDRWPRRRVMLGCDAARAALVLGLALPGVPVGGLLLLLTAVAWLGTPFEAARAATLPLVLPAEQQYVAGSALTMISNQLSQVVGLAGGGLLLAVLSTRGALLLDSASFVVSGLLIGLLVRPRVAVAGMERVPLWRSVVDGARLVFGTPLLRSLLLLAWLVAAFTVLPEGLAVAQAHRLSAPTGVAGALLAAVPAGALLAALVLGRLGPELRSRCVLPLSALGLLALGASAFAGSWPVLALAWLVVGVGAAVQLPASALFLRSVPDAFRARAFGLAQTGLMAGQGLALLAAGVAAELLGLQALLAAAAGLGLVLLGLLVVRWPLPPVRSRWAWRPSPVDAWIATVTVVAAASVTVQLLWLAPRPSPTHVSPWVLGAVFFATGSYVATLRRGRHAHVFQLDDIPRLVGLFLVSPAALIGARLGGAALALVVVRHQRGRKLVFNLASFALEVTVALATFHLLVPGRGIGPAVWPAALAATVLADLVSAWTVGVVIGLAEGDLRLRRVLVPDRVALGTALGAATVGMIAATTLWYAPSSGVLILLLVALGMLGLRAVARLAAEGDAQQHLQTVLGELGSLEPDRDSLLASLEQVRRLLAVEALECWVSPLQGDGDGPLSGWSVVQAPDTAVQLDGTARDRLALQALSARAPGDVVAEPPLRGRLPGRVQPGVQRLAVALPGERSGPGSSSPALGVLVASAPIGDRRVLSALDADALQTTAGMLSQALRRVDHHRRLLLTATHDPLTGLATLVELRRQLGELLAGSASVAVLLVNLGRLRAVNDVFGRDTGDHLIAATAQRLTQLAPAGSVLGRVSGHHLACAFPTEGAGSVTRQARRLRAELELPLTHEGVDAEGGVHIGISLAPAHGSDPEVLLRRAEAAGDAAKVDPFGVALFARDLEQDAARSLRLVSDLRTALARPGELAVHYQPKRSLLTGDVLGCEALLRWQHPELGPVPPDEFVGLAESTTLIGDLTAFVLDEALQQSARWCAAGLPDTVAVNLSARSLLDNDLVQHVAGALRRYDVDPGRLVLEITETSVMAQPTRSVLVLDALSELGVRLSVDDFGTGYSNLSYLRQLPVQEVKLDRTFLSPLPGEAPFGEGGGRAHEFVRHAIALVHALGLLVVVEGVEDARSLEALRVLGADAVQGYFISRPLPADALTAWMATDLSAAVSPAASPSC
jgi:diguanylate cyclase (GGDEF)-like protein